MYIQFAVGININKIIHIRTDLASHCPEVDIRWPYEYGILKLVPNLVNSQSTVEASTMPTEGNTNHTRRLHEDVIFFIKNLTRRTHKGRTIATRRHVESTMRSN